MKVIVAGTRTIEDYEVVCKAIEESGFEITELVSGGARGVDKLGERWAKENGVPVNVFQAEWEKYGNRAGPIRNVAMGSYADALIAIRHGPSPGTSHMVSFMGTLGKPRKVTNI